MLRPHPHKALLQSPPHSAAFSQPAFNIKASIHAAGEEWRVFNPCAVREIDAFEVLYVVSMEMVNQTNGNHFDLTVYVHWDAYPHLPEVPSEESLFGIARNLIREHFEDNRYPPRFSGQRRGIELRWPELDEYEGTI